MPKFRYAGNQPLKLAQVGDLVPGEVFEVEDGLAKGLKTHAPEQFIPVKADVPLGPPEAKAAAPAGAPAA